MKIAVLSDVHGNVPALEAVLNHLERWCPDELIVNGDLISRGPYSLTCLRTIQARQPRTRFIQGNHEALVISCADQPRDRNSPTFDLSKFAQWTAIQLDSAVEEIRSWTNHLDLTELEGGSLHITHGSRLGNRDGIHPETTDQELPAKLGDPRDLFIASHTHRPVIRQLNGTQVVNVGSVGQPLDDDPRAAYGQFEFYRGRWQSQIVRVAYDKASAERDFHESGFLSEAGPIARLILLELQESRMHVGPWMTRYYPAVKSGELTVTSGVDQYLRSL